MVNYDLEIKNGWRKASDLLKSKQMDDARDTLDYCLILLSQVVLERKLRDTDKLGGVKMLVWYERIWVALEKNNLLPVKISESEIPSNKIKSIYHTNRRK